MEKDVKNCENCAYFMHFTFRTYKVSIDTSNLCHGRCSGQDTRRLKAGDRVAGGRIEDIGLKWWQREMVHTGSSITLPVR